MSKKSLLLETNCVKNTLNGYHLQLKKKCFRLHLKEPAATMGKYIFDAQGCSNKTIMDLTSYNAISNEWLILGDGES